MRNYDQMENGLDKMNNMLTTAKSGMQHKNIQPQRVYELIDDSLKTLELIQTLFRREKP